MHTSPLSFCTCGSSWKMAPHHTISAVSFDLIGRNEVVVETKRCPQCKMIYGPNFRNRDGQLINTTKISDMALDEVLFINMKVGFTIRFLKYHAYLFFRCCSTGRGVHFAYEQTFFDNLADETPPLHTKFRELYYDGLFYYMVGLEWEVLGKHTSIVIGKEIDESTLMTYDAHCHEHLLPPLRPKKVSGVVADGHHKVLVKTCGNQTPTNKNRVGRPRDDGNQKRGHGHGWFMVVDPVSGRILGVTSQDEPEGNKVVTQSLLKILPQYPNIDLLVMDRACHYMPSAVKTPGLEQLKYFSLDRFHSYGHTKNCPCNPRSKTRLKKRIKNLNTSIAEQTFSWFRGYSKVLNDMHPLRHRFAVLLFCKQHNDLVACGDTYHLNQYKVYKGKGATKPYACNKVKGKKTMKPGSMKVMKAMKVMKSMKVMKVMKSMK